MWLKSTHVISNLNTTFQPECAVPSSRNRLATVESSADLHMEYTLITEYCVCRYAPNRRHLCGGRQSLSSGLAGLLSLSAC